VFQFLGQICLIVVPPIADFLVFSLFSELMNSLVHEPLIQHLISLVIIIIIIITHEIVIVEYVLEEMSMGTVFTLPW